jgi:amidase
MKGSNLLAVNVACDGVVTRTVRDTVAFFAAIESRHAPRRVAPIGQVADRPARPLRMGVFVGAPTGTPVNAEVQKAALAAARLCETLGHVVEEISCPFEGGVFDDFLRYWALLAWLQVWTGRLGKKLAGLAATRRLRRFSSTFAQVMERHDVLISPTLAEPAPSLGYLAPDLPFNTAFERVRAYAAFTTFYNVSGAPAITLPLGRSSAGLPIGVQFAAAHGSDRALLELALSIEAAQPWPGVAPREAWVSTATRASH